MDEKTEQLRDIFIQVADESTVTERQEESPGTLTGDGSVEERLDDLISNLRDRYRFSTDLDTASLRDVAHGFYDDQSDEAIAADLDVAPEEIFRARLDLHLLREEDTDGPVDFSTVREALREGEDSETVADRLDIDRGGHFERLWAVAETERDMRAASYRFRDEFDDILGDGDVAARLTDDVTADGLEDATEGMEIETGF